MKRVNLLFGVIFLLISSAFAQDYQYVSSQSGDTLVVKDDIEFGGTNTLYLLMQSDSLAPADRVYMLKNNGIYSCANNPVSSSKYRTIIMGQTQTSLKKATGNAPPVISGDYETGISTYGGITVGKDLLIKNIDLEIGNSAGNNGGWTFFDFKGTGMRLQVDNCIMEHTWWTWVGNVPANESVFFTNDYFVNLNGYACRRNGSVVDFIPGSAIHEDTLIVENCTHVNTQGSLYKFRHGETVGKVVFNHNDFIDCAGYIFMNNGDQTNMSVTNNIFVNCQLQGYAPPLAAVDVGEVDMDGLPMGLVNLRVDSIFNANGKNFYADKNLAYWDPSLSDIVSTLNSNQVDHSTQWVSQMILMNSRTDSLFADKTNYPLLTNGTWYGQLPNFKNTDVLFTTQLAKLKAYAIACVDTNYGAPLDSWRQPSNPEASNFIYADWPIPIDLSYTDSNLLTVGLGGFPLGDLDWFPSQKTAWLSQKDQEYSNIGTILKTGIASVFVSLDTVGGSTGDSVLVPINVKNFNNVGAITLKIHFDHTALQFGQAKNWNSQLSGALSNAIGDTLSIAWSSVSGISISNGKLVDLQFLYKDSAASSLKFIPNLCEVADVNASVLGIVYVNGVVVPGLTINGQVTYDNINSTPLQNVNVYLAGQLPGLPGDSTITDASGNYIFNGLSSGIYQLSGRSTKTWSGVNATDALVVKRQVVGLDTLKGIRLTAADVNFSHSVNATDALVIQQRVVGMIDHFAIPDWVFETPTDTLASSSIVQNIKGLCAGDVNGSYNPVVAKTAATINIVSTDTIQTSPKNDIQVPISISDAARIGAVTLYIRYNESMVDVEGVSSKAPGLLYNSKDGLLSISWCDVKPLALKAGEPLLTVNLKPKEDFKAGSTLNLTVDPQSELANAEGKVMSGVKVNVPSVQAVLPKEYLVTQNYPNPFNPSTTIKYDLPEQAAVTIEVFNVLGQRVQILENGVQAAGSYKLIWDASRMASGVYIYRFMAHGRKDYTQIKKMVLLK